MKLYAIAVLFVGAFAPAFSQAQTPAPGASTDDAAAISKPADPPDSTPASNRIKLPTSNKPASEASKTASEASKPAPENPDGETGKPAGETSKPTGETGKVAGEADKPKEKVMQEVQEIDIKVTGAYDPALIEVEKGIPVVIKLHRKDAGECAEWFEIPSYGIRKHCPGLKTTEVRFTPKKTGTVAFRCGMDMMHGQFKVVEAEKQPTSKEGATR